MHLFVQFASLSLLLSISTCHSTEQPALTPTVQAQRLRTEVLTRYLPADQVSNNGIALPSYTHDGTTFKAVTQVKTVYAYDGQGRLLTETVSEPFRATDPYGNNYTRRYTYADRQLTIENVGLTGRVLARFRYQLNEQGYVVGDLADPNQQWVYDKDNYLLRLNTLQQTFSGGNRVRQTNLTGDVTDYTHELTKPNPVLNPTDYYWGKPDRNQLTGSTTKQSALTRIDGSQATYTYQVNAQGVADRRLVLTTTKPAAGYTMAQGKPNDQLLEITDYEYE